jgi:hypothetical protein
VQAAQTVISLYGIGTRVLVASSDKWLRLLGFPTRTGRAIRPSIFGLCRLVRIV